MAPEVCYWRMRKDLGRSSTEVADWGKRPQQDEDPEGLRVLVSSGRLPKWLAPALPVLMSMSGSEWLDDLGMPQHEFRIHADYFTLRIAYMWYDMQFTSVAVGWRGDLSSKRMKMVLPLAALCFLTILGMGPIPIAYGQTCTGSAVIQANFGNNTPGTPDSLWFNAVLIESSAPVTPGTVTFIGQTITFYDPNTGSVTLHLPDSEIVFSSTATTATTTFTGGKWVTTVPTGANDGNVFLSGYTYVPPSGGMGHINSPQGVYWSGTFTSTYGATLNWKWAAASYVSFSSTYASLNVKPIDATTGSSYSNGDHAGTPEAFTTPGNNVQGGRGGGGSNWTGSYSASKGVCPGSPPSVPEFTDGSIAISALIVVLLPLLLVLRRRSMGSRPERWRS